MNKSDINKNVALVSGIISILFILMTGVSFHEKTMAELEVLKSQQTKEKARINGIEERSTENSTNVNALRANFQENSRAIITNAQKISKLKDASSQYVLLSQFRGSMDIIHKDHQDSIKSRQKDNLHVSSEFSNVYRTILNLYK
jgi:hypothetical protein